MAFLAGAFFAGAFFTAEVVVVAFRAAAALVGLFLAVALVVDAFFAAGLALAVFVAGAFLAVALVAGAFLAVVFFAVEVTFLAAAPAFLAGDFFAVDFVAVFFAAAFVALAFLVAVLVAGAFFAVDFVTVFFAAAFVAVAFLAVDLAGAFLAVVLVAGAFFAVDFEAGAFFAVEAFLVTVAVAFLAVLLAAPTALPAVDVDELFLPAAVLVDDDFVFDCVAAFFCAAGTCASWSVVLRQCRGSCRGRPVRSSPAYDLDNIARRDDPIRETCRRVSRCIGRGPRDIARASAMEFPLCTNGIRPRSDHEPGPSPVKMNLRQSGPFIGVAGMATTLFLYIWSALVMRDVLFALVLPLVWLLLFGLSVAWFTKHPLRVLALPFVATAVWFWAMLA